MSLLKIFTQFKRFFFMVPYAKGHADDDSDIDVGVIVDLPDHLKRVDITADLFHYARRIDVRIEPKYIFWDEYNNCDPASILSEMIRTGIVIA